MSEVLLSPGSTVAGFRIVRPLHLAARSQVYLARPAAEGPLAALKLLVGRGASGLPEEQDAALREASACKAVESDHVARFLAMGPTPFGPFIATEFVPGLTLDELVRSLARRGRGLRLADALTVIRGMALGLSAAHSAPNADGGIGIVHRDLSPHNVMLGPEGEVKLIDFGLAKVRSSASRSTSPGTVKGSLRYLAPEQCTNAALSPATDLFALGIILFELSTGTRWMRERDDMRALELMVAGERPLPSQRRAPYPESLEKVVLQLLDASPRRRLGPASKLVETLESLASAEGLPLSPAALGQLVTRHLPPPTANAELAEQARPKEPLPAAPAEASSGATERLPSERHPPGWRRSGWRH